MTKEIDEFKPGEKVPVSGIYDVIHDKLDGHDHALVGLEYGQYQRLSYAEREHNLLDRLHHGQQCD